MSKLGTTAGATGGTEMFGTGTVRAFATSGATGTELWRLAKKSDAISSRTETKAGDNPGIEGGGTGTDGTPKGAATEETGVVKVVANEYGLKRAERERLPVYVAEEVDDLDLRQREEEETACGALETGALDTEKSNA